MRTDTKLPRLLLAALSILLTQAGHVRADQGNPKQQTLKPGMTIVKAVPAKTSQPLRSKAAVKADTGVPSAARTFQDRQLIIPKTMKTAPKSTKATSATLAAPIVQDGPVGRAMPTTFANFEGVGNVNGVLPPDTQGDIGWDPATGTKYYVQWVNLSYQIWDVTDPAAPSSLVGPKAGNTLWAGMGGLCESNNDGDPLTRFDSLSNRWVMSQFALGFPDDFHQCVAVSATADPTGEWYLYDFQTSTTKMNDYGKLGIWPDGYYMSFNQFDGSTQSWAGAAVAVFERDKMLLGQAARMIYIDTGTVTLNYGGLLPSDLDGAAPPVGTPNYFMEWDDSAWLGDATDTLRIWEFKTDWTNTANTTFGLNATYDPNLKLSTVEVNPDVCVQGVRNCVPQPGTTQKLDAISDRLMYRLQYRNFGGYQTLVGNHTVDSTGTDQAGIHWFELRNTGSGFSMNQEGIFSPDTDNRWMGSAAMDISGNIALGYSVSSSATFPSVRYSGRLAGDPAGTLPQGEATLVAGGGSQTSTSARWGDYSMMAVDPSDGCTFWYTQEYMQATGVSNWHTRIGSFRFPTCTTTVTGTLSGTVLNSSSLPMSGVTIGITGGYSTVTDAAGHYSIPLAAGTYDVTASKYGFIPSTASGVTVSAPGTTTQNFTLSASPDFTIDGVVRDSTTSWPLYARIDIPGYPGGPVFTNPVTGAYSVRLAYGSHTFTVTAMSGGYTTAAQVVDVSADAGRDINLTANLATCAAPGYQAILIDGFDTSTPPGFSASWAVTDVSGADGNWTTLGASLHPPGVTPHSTANMAVFNSWTAAAGNSTRLHHVRGFDLSAQSSVELSFWLYHDVEYADTDTLQVQVSTDAGTSWNNAGDPIFRYDGTRGWSNHSISLNAYTGVGMTDVRIGLLASSAFGNDIHVDDVSIHNESGCSPIPSGGLVIGSIRDANTGAVVSNATVHDADLNSATTIDSSADTARPARMYVIGQAAGPRSITATAPSYGTGSVTPTVIAGGTAWQDIVLATGRLSVTPTSLMFTLTKDDPVSSLPLYLANSGGVTSSFQIFSLAGSYTPSVPTGPFADNTRHIGPKNLHDKDARNLRVDPTPTGITPLSLGDVATSWPSGLTYAWGIGFNTDAGDLWLGNIDTMLDNRFTPQGVNTGDTIDISSWVVDFAADMTYNPFTKTLWQVNAAGDTCIYELDPTTRISTGNKICPAFGTSERGLAFDPVTNTYYSGSWNDGVINHFAPDGSILDSKATGLGISGLAFNPGTGHLFVMTNTNNVTNPLSFDIYILDTKAAYAILGGFNLRNGGVKAFADYAQAGLELDCSGNLWAVDQVAQQVYLAPSGETGVCDWQATWLTVTPSSGSVAAGGTQPLTASANVSSIPEGIHTAYFKVANATPYGPVIVPVTVTVNSKLTVTRNGSGSGAIISLPEGIHCGDNCAVYYPPNTVVSLTAVPATYSSFMGWGGDPDCADGVVTLDTSKTCSATFSITPVRVLGHFETIQAAYNAVQDNGTIQVQENTFDEEVEFGRPISVVLKGGYTSDFTAANGMTTIEGKLTIKSGKAAVSKLILRKQ